MAKSITVSSVRKRLNRDYRRAKTWRGVALIYQVNQRYVYDLAMHGIEPKNQEVRYRLGLDTRPKPAWLAVAVRFLREREKV